jgi:hypothetical protein
MFSLTTLKSAKVNNLYTEGATPMEDLEEALRNIDIFCRALVGKIAEEGNEGNNMSMDPIESLFRRKYIKEETESSSASKHLIPLPQLEEPLIDVIEDDYHFKVLMQCRCRDEEAIVRSDTENIQICKKVCQTNSDGMETCRTECRDLDLPVDQLQIENIVAKCTNNQAFEVDIPKV